MGVAVGSNNYTTPVQRTGGKIQSDIQSARKQVQDLGAIKINVNCAPLVMLMKKLGRNRTVEQETYQWEEEDGLPKTVTTTASEIAATTTTINVAAGTGRSIVAGQLLWVQRTNELIRVSSVSVDALTVVRAVTGDSTNGEIIATGGVAEEITLLHTSFVENSTAPPGVAVEPPILSNDTQTRRTAWEASGRVINSSNYGTDEWERIEKDTVEEHQAQKELSLLFTPGRANSGATISKGVAAFITTNRFNQAGDLSEASLADWNVKWHRRNRNQKQNLLCVGGENIGKALDSFARDGLRYRPDDDFLGMEVAGWQSSFGTLKFMQHPAFSPLTNSITAANRGLVGMAMGLNLANLGEVTFKGRGLRREKDIEAISTDGKKAGIIEDVGWLVANEKSHFHSYGITGPF